MALTFNGNTANYAQLAYAFSSGKGTWMAWCRIATDRNAYSTFVQTNATDTQQACLQTGADGTTLSLYIYDNTVTGTNLTVGTWYHLAITWDGTSARAYVNGVLDITNTATGSTWNEIELGRSYWGEPLDGNIAYVKAWDATLNSTEIATEKASVMPVRLTNLVGFWPTRSGTARVNDISGAGNSFAAYGTLTDYTNPFAVGWDDVTISESVTVSVQAAPGGGTLSVSVSDSATISESVALSPWYVGAATNGNTTAGTTASASVPTGTAAGDVEIAVIVVEVASATITPDATGWTQLWNTPLSTRTHTQAAFYRFAGGSEPGSYSFTVSSGEWACAIVTYRNATNPTLYNSQVNNSSTATCTAPSLTVATDGSMSLWVGSSMYGTTWTPPTNYTERVDYRTSTGSSNLCVTIAQRVVAAGSTGTVAGTAANADYNVGGQIIFAPLTVAGISVSDSATISESVTVSVAAAGAALSVNVSDSATIAETITAKMAAALSINVSDSATISETVTISFASGISDAFTDTNGTALATHNSNWVVNFGAFAINTNSAYANSASAISMAHWQGSSFANDQYAQATVAAIGSAGSIGVAVRCASGTTATGYVFYSDMYLSYLFKYVAGSFTQIGSTGQAFAAGDVIRLEVIGTTLRPLINGSLWNQGEKTDSSISSGYAGIGGYGNSTTSRIDDWSGGDISTAISVNVSDAATIAETVGAAMALPGVSAADSATLADVPTVQVQAATPRTVNITTDSAAIGETITVQPLGVAVSASDSASIGEVVTTAMALPGVSVSDSATIADTPTVVLNAATARTVNVSDSATVADSVTIEPPDLERSITDAVTISETVTVALPLAGVSVGDAATVSDAPTVRMAAALAVNVTDTATASDAPTVTVVSAGQMIVSVSDAASIAETVTAALALPGVSVTDTASVGETITVQPLAVAASAADSATAAEAVTVAALRLQASVSDTATIGESVTLSVLAAGQQVVSVADAASVAESVAATVLLPGVSVSDSASIAESVTVAVAALGAQSVNVTDSATIADAVTLALALPGVSLTDSATAADVPALQTLLAGIDVTDAATVGESVTVTMQAMRVVVSDSAMVGESVTSIVAAAATLSINVGDSITATDAALATMALPGVSVADAVTAAESVNVLVQLQGQLYVSVNDDAVATDTALIGPMGLALSTDDVVGIVETCTATMALPGVSVGDVVSAADVLVALLLAVAHGDWTLGDAAVNGWALRDAAVNGWAMRDVAVQYTTTDAAEHTWTVTDLAVYQWVLSDRSKG